MLKQSTTYRLIKYLYALHVNPIYLGVFLEYNNLVKEKNNELFGLFYFHTLIFWNDFLDIIF